MISRRLGGMDMKEEGYSGTLATIYENTEYNKAKILRPRKLQIPHNFCLLIRDTSDTEFM
jgi:hypothetical protein